MRSGLAAVSVALLIVALVGCGGSSQVASSTQAGPGASASASVSSTSTTASTRTSARHGNRSSTPGSKLFVPGRNPPAGTYDPSQRLRSILRHLSPAHLRQLERRARTLRGILRECRRGGSATGPQLVGCLRRHGL